LDCARQAVQRELYERLFAGQSVDVYLEDVVKRVRNGDLDEALVYRKNLRKDAVDYTATTPPHVVAAASPSSRWADRSAMSSPRRARNPSTMYGIRSTASTMCKNR